MKKEEFLFLAKRYKEQAEEEVKKWTAHIEEYEKLPTAKQDAVATSPMQRGVR